jgi:hypothetical protein
MKGVKNMTMNYIKKIEEDVYRIFETIGHPIQKKQFYIQDFGVPHEPTPLPANKMAIYMFIHNGQFLKIGKVGKNSNPRFQYHHYKPTRAPSTLSKSLLNDSSMNDYGLNIDNVEHWMKQNLHRINIIFNAELGNNALALVETNMHYTFKPKYEGNSR